MTVRKSHRLLSGRATLKLHFLFSPGSTAVNQTASRNAGFRLDHVVIAVSDLDQAIADYRRLGFTVNPGGVHHGGASHNALVVFADGSYFELIAYMKPSPDVRWWKLL